MACRRARASNLSLSSGLPQLLKALKHPNIVSCKESFIEDGKLCIVMDYCSEGAQGMHD